MLILSATMLPTSSGPAWPPDGVRRKPQLTPPHSSPSSRLQCASPTGANHHAQQRPQLHPSFTWPEWLLAQESSEPHGHDHGHHDAANVRPGRTSPPSSSMGHAAAAAAHSRALVAGPAALGHIVGGFSPTSRSSVSIDVNVVDDSDSDEESMRARGLAGTVW